MKPPDKIIGVTGHRKLSHNKSEIYSVVKESLLYLRDKKGYTKAITGMALGFDTIVAQVCVEINMPFIAALAFENQSEKWNTHDTDRYKHLLDKAEYVKQVSTGNWENWKYLKRDTWIVENSDMLMAYLNDTRDPGRTGSGTGFTVNEAIRLGKPWRNIFPLCTPPRNI